MMLDQHMNAVYDKEHYNCRHFARDVWQTLTGQDIGNLLNNPLGVKDRIKLLKEPVFPCIALYRQPTGEVHVGVRLRRTTIHLTEKGVENLAHSLVARGYRKQVRYYAPCL